MEKVEGRYGLNCNIKYQRNRLSEVIYESEQSEWVSWNGREGGFISGKYMIGIIF